MDKLLNDSIYGPGVYNGDDNDVVNDERKTIIFEKDDDGYPLLPPESHPSRQDSTRAKRELLKQFVQATYGVLQICGSYGVELTPLQLAIHIVQRLLCPGKPFETSRNFSLMTSTCLRTRCSVDQRRCSLMTSN